MPSGPEFIIVFVIVALLAAPALLVLVVLRRTSRRDAPAPAIAAAAWYPDPTQRHEIRWFDGTTWTEYVCDRGVTAVDPLR